MNLAGRVLLSGGVLSFAAALLHVAIIAGGPDWYRFFGAGEELAGLSEQGSVYPALVTACIALVLAVWGLYALSGAGLIVRLPWTGPVLFLIAAVLILRGIAGIPFVFLSESPWAGDLRADMMFMVLSSVVSFVMGLCYATGYIHFRRSVSRHIA